MDATFAFLAVSTQWRRIGRADGSVFTQGLDYSGARDGLALAGIDVTPEIWSQVRFIELGAKDALNGQ